MRDFEKEQHGMEQLQEILQDSLGSPVPYPVRHRQESWNVGAGSGYERPRQAAWDEREMRTVTTKLRREVYEKFRAICEEHETTPYSVLKDFLLAYVDHFGGGSGG